MSEKIKVALVTGSAKRVGKMTVTKLHKKGYNVVIHCNKSVDLATQLSQELNSSRPNSAVVVSSSLDANVENVCKQIISETVSVWGRLDLLVNNASSFTQTTLGNITDQSWDSMLNANLKAPVFLAQAAMPHLKATHGSIVNMVDILGERPTSTQLEYCVSKGGLITATKSLALLAGPEVRVNGVAPGAVDWPEVDLEFHNNDFQKDYINRTPLGRLGTPEEASDAVLFLASKEASFMTGHILKVDGGRSLQL